MPNFLFLYYYETPDQLRANPLFGTSVEEIRALLIEAENEAQAVRCGIKLASDHVRQVYEREVQVRDFEWDPARYRHWVEQCPHEKWSEAQLRRIPRVRVEENVAEEGFGALPARRGAEKLAWAQGT
jgi:hypothetical protein